MSGDTERRQTQKQPKIDRGDRLTIDLEDADQAADFLEYVAKLVREKKKITIVIE